MHLNWERVRLSVLFSFFCSRLLLNKNIRAVYTRKISLELHKPRSTCKTRTYGTNGASQAADNISHGLCKMRVLSEAWTSRALIYKTRNHSYKWYRGLFATCVKPELTLHKLKVFPRSRKGELVQFRDCYDNQHKNEALIINKPCTSRAPFIRALRVLYKMRSCKWTSSRFMQAAACVIRGKFFLK